MGPHEEDRWCQRCRAKSEMLNGICRCGWNCDEDRPATEGELVAVAKKMEEACADLQDALDTPMYILDVQHAAAELRGLSEDEREQVAQGLVETSDLTIDEARQWIADLIERESEE